MRGREYLANNIMSKLVVKITRGEDLQSPSLQHHCNFGDRSLAANTRVEIVRIHNLR